MEAVSNRVISPLVWLAVLVGGVVAYLAVLWTMLATGNPLYFPTLLFVGSVTVPVATMLYASGGRQGPLAPTGVLVFVAVAGGVVGTLAAGLLEYETLRRLTFLPMILVGLIEESAKLIVPVIVLLFFRQAVTWAGVAVGVASATGFATLETMGYGFVTLVASRGDVAAVDATLLWRALLSPACHIAWTGLTAAALWRMRRDGSPGWFAGAFVAAVVLHATWDSSGSLAVRGVVALVSIAGLLTVLGMARRRASGSLAHALLGTPRHVSPPWSSPVVSSNPFGADGTRSVEPS